MVKNLLSKIGISAILSIAPIIYSGCQVTPTTYEEKQQYLENRIEERNASDYDSSIIVPLFKVQ